MPTPTWLAATSTQPTKAAQLNQFLGTHAATLVYPGALQSSQNTAGSGGVNSNGLWIAQSFTTGASQTATGRVFLTLGLTGTPAPLTLALYANSGGAPSGSPLATTLVPHEYVGGSPSSLQIPLPVTGLTASTTYWLVAQAVGDGSDFYTWSKSNQTSGASTSTNGTSWTAQSYGLLYQEYDNSVGGPLAHTWEDSGARWTLFFYAASGLPTTIAEYTVAQGTSQYLWQVRALSYTSGILTGIA